MDFPIAANGDMTINGDNSGLIIWLISLVCLTIFLFYTALKNMKRYRLIQDIPTSKIRAVAIGIAELNGTIYADQTIKTPLSQIDCVYYRLITEEYNHNGKSKSWKQVDSKTNFVNFWLNDDTGKIQVNPKEVEAVIPVNRTFLSKSSWGKLQPPKLLEQNRKPIFATVGDRLYSEYFIKPQDQIYVIGTVTTSSKDPRDIQITKGDENSIFLISNQSEKNLVRSLKIKTFVSFISGIVSAIIATVVIMSILQRIIL